MPSLPILKTVQIDRKSIIKRNKVVMSPDINEFITVVAEVAVPGFNAQKLAIYIEPAHLEKLIITYAFENRRCIAFASCVILKKTDINGNPYVVGKGFPGIRIDVRTSTNPNPAYSDLFQQLFTTMIYHFMIYRIENIDFMYNQFNKLIGDVKKSGFSSSDFMDLTKMNLATIFLAFYKNKGGDMDLLMDELERMNNQVPFYIESYAENPVMFRSLRQFIYEGPRPSDNELIMLRNLRNVEQLLTLSYQQSKRRKEEQNPFLFPIKAEVSERGKSLIPNLNHEILVNITASEWRSTFEYAMSGDTDDHLYVRYFLWMNYRFPNYAFNIKIPVNAQNLGGRAYFFELIKHILDIK